MTENKAVYLDGLTSFEREADIILQAEGLTISIAERPQIFWSFASIKIEKEFDAQSQRAVFSNGFSPGERLLVSRASDYAQISEHLKVKHAFAIPFTFKALTGMLLICAVLIVSGFYYIRYESRILAPLIPDKIQTAYVDMISKSLHANETVCSKEQARKIEKLAWKIAAANELKAPRILIVPDSKINAFAIPGNAILINRGMIRAVENESELAGILAHEMGHLKHRHPQQTFIHTIGAGIFSGLVFGTTDIGVLSQTISAVNGISYSRSMEAQADDSAVEFMQKADIDGKNLSRLLDRIEAQNKDLPAIEVELGGYLSSHTVTAERMQKFSLQKPKNPQRFLKDAEWKTIKRVCTENKDK